MAFPSKGGKFCSHKCYGKAHLKNKNINWRGGKVKQICGVCGVEFEIHPNQLKQGRGKYCSKKCQYASPEFRKRLSMANKGKKCLLKTRKKLSIALKGKYPSAKTRKKLSTARKSRVGQKAPRWAGGRSQSRYGYVYIYFPKHPFATSGGYVLEHRLVMEKSLGRYLTPKEIVHHKPDKNGNYTKASKSDNRLEQLKLFPNQSHHLNSHKELRGNIKNRRM